MPEARCMSSSALETTPEERNHEDQLLPAGSDNGTPGDTLGWLGGTVCPVRRHLYIYQGRRGQFQAQQVALLCPRQAAQCGSSQGLDGPGGLSEWDRPYPHGDNREAGGERNDHLVAVL